MKFHVLSIVVIFAKIKKENKERKRLE